MRCYRHLDRPFVVFLGLGPVDLMAILLAGTLLLVVANPVVAVIGATGVAFALKRVKEGKPRGYLFTLIYRSGLLSLLPQAARPPWLVKPPIVGKSPIVRFSGVPGDPDDEPEEVRYYRGPRRYSLDGITLDESPGVRLTPAPTNRTTALNPDRRAR